MKSYLRIYLKKTLAIMLTVVMLLSCWVWVEPTKADAAAANAGTYYWKLVYKRTSNMSGSHAVDFNLYITFLDLKTGATEKKKVSECANLSNGGHMANGDSNFTDGTNGFTHDSDISEYIMYGYESRFPLSASFDIKRTGSGLSSTHGCEFTLYVSGSNDKYEKNSGTCKASKSLGDKEGNSGSTGNVELPKLTNTEWTVSSTSISPPVDDRANTNIYLEGYDQYGVKLYGNTEYKIISAQPLFDNSLGDAISYDNVSIGLGTGTNKTYTPAEAGVPVTLYAGPVTDEDALVGQQAYRINLGATFTCQNDHDKTSLVASTTHVDVNQPNVGALIYTAQATTNYGVIAPTKADGVSGTVNYGAPANASIATIGGYNDLEAGELKYFWEVNLGTIPSLKSENSGRYIKRDGYIFSHFGEAGNHSSAPYYIVQNAQGNEAIDDTPTYVDGITADWGEDEKIVYGWWIPENRTVTFINADGSYLYQNTQQPYDHQAYYGGGLPTYERGATFSEYAFAGWINLNTGELIEGYGQGGVLLPGQYIAEDTTFMAYYTAKRDLDYSIIFDYNDNGIVDGDDVKDNDKNGYYDKIYRATEVPSLIGEVFSPSDYFAWVDAGIIGVNGGVVSDVTENGFTLTSTTTDDAYTERSPAVKVSPNTTYNVSINMQDHTPGGMTGSTQVFIFYYTSDDGSGAYASHDNITGLSKSGNFEGKITTPAGCNSIRIRLDANNKGNVIRFSDFKIWNEEETLTKDSTAEIDYSNPCWIDAKTGAPLTDSTRISEETMRFIPMFEETVVNYSVTLITGTNNNTVIDQGNNIYHAATSGDVVENDTYTWADTVTLYNPGNFADGVYNYEFMYWVDENGTRRDVGYELAKADGVTAADGIYNDEFIRADGMNEAGGKDSKTYTAVYMRSSKTYTVKFVDDEDNDLTQTWSGEYLSILPITTSVIPADQTKVDTAEVKRYSYTFLGWDNTLTKATERYTAAQIADIYTSGVVADAVYKPVFASVYHYYVTFQNADGSVITFNNGLENNWYEPGQVITSAELPENNGATILTPPSDQVYTYRVEGWATALGAKLVPGETAVTSDIVYIAQLEQTYQKYDVNFYQDDFTTLIGTVADVEYGSRPNGRQIPAATKAQTDEFIYVFQGWDDMSTDAVVENYKSATDLPVVHGEQDYRAVYKQTKRPYEIKFMVPDGATVDASANMTLGAYKEYHWHDSGIEFGEGHDKWPAFYLNERVTAPSVQPELTVDVPTGYHIEFIGWFTEPYGQGEILNRTTKITGPDSADTYYAYFEVVGDEYYVQFYESADAVIPFYTYTGVKNGDNILAIAQQVQAELTAYYDADGFHYTFDKWLLENGSDASDTLASVPAITKVYASYNKNAHNLGAWETVIAATYFAPGVERNTCDVCGYYEERAIEMLKDTSAPTGQFIIADVIGGKQICTSDSFITDFDDETHYVPYDEVDVMLNTTDVGRGVDSLYYAVLNEEMTLAQIQNFIETTGIDQLIADGVLVKANSRNAHFTLAGAEGESYIVYALVIDGAKDWAAADVDETGMPASMTDAPHATYLSSCKLVFDKAAPVIKAENEHKNPTEEIFCGPVTITATDANLVYVVVNGTITDAVDGTFTATYTEAGTYTVLAFDETALDAYYPEKEETVYTFTIVEHTFKEVVTDPTCTDKGYTTKTCENCGLVEIVDEVDALGHTYEGENDGWVTMFAPWCEINGMAERICSVCGEVEEKEIPALGHKYVDVNGDEVIDENDIIELIPATCDTDGLQGHLCERCNTAFDTSVIPALGHNYDANGDGEVTTDDAVYTEPVCGVDGYWTYTCQVRTCRHSYTVTHENTALSHNYEAEVIYEETCGRLGVTKYTCSLCGDVYYEEIGKGEHDAEWVTTIYATCLTKGEEQHICSVCGEVLDTREIPIADHEYGEWVVVTEPDCENKGLRKRICKNNHVCGAFETEDIDALEHDFQFVETVAPTTEKGGYDLYKCSRCDAEEKRNPTDPLATFTITVYGEDGTTLVETLGATENDVIASEADINAVAPEKAGYTFDKWVYLDGSEITYPITVTANIEIKAVYTINQYTVTWMNGSDKLEEDVVDYLTAPCYDGKIPEKAATEYYTYTFKGWATSADATVEDIIEVYPNVTEDVTYYAVYEAKGRLYKITWVHWDGTVLEETEAAYNTLPEIPEVTVEGTSDNTADYAWDGGWTPQVRLVTGEATYTATYTATPKTVSINFYEEDGTTVYTTQTYNVGDTFVLPAGPSKSSTDQYTYTFDAWVAVDEEATNAPVVGQPIAFTSNNYAYKATYTSHSINYFVTFVDEDGEEIDRLTLLYGAAITAPTAPVKEVPAEDAGKYVYEFAGWKYRGTTYTADAMPTVSGDMTFAPVYNQIYNEFTVIFKNFDGTKTYKTETLVYGDEIDYSGATPFIPRDAQYTYEWLGWATTANSDTALETLGTVTADAIFYAAFKKELRKYNITFNVDGTEVVREFTYGDTVAYPAGEEGVPSTDKQDTAYRDYTFEGWSATENGAILESFPTVTGKATYYAVYSSTINQVTATWQYDAENVIATVEDNYGFTPEFAGETPVKATDDGVDGANYSYKFTGWIDQDGTTYAADASFGRITKDMVYTAQFEKVYVEYKVTFTDKDGATISENIYKYDEAITAEKVPANLDDYDTADTHYYFKGWKLVDGDEFFTAEQIAAVKVTENITYVPYYASEAFKTYNVVFNSANGATETLQFITGQAITAPETDPADWTDAQGGNAEYYYTFKGWSATENGEIVADFSSFTFKIDTPAAPETAYTFYAVYEKIEPTYFVTFRNESGDLLSSVSYKYGETVKVAEDQVKAATNTKIYTFEGWSNTSDATTALDSIPAVTGQVTYYPVFSEATRYYTVTFLNEDGTEISKVTDYEYGADLVKPADPTKADTDAYTYTFKGWTPNVPTKVTKDATYTAQFTTTAKEYTVFFYDVDVEGNVVMPAYSYSVYNYNDKLVAPADPFKADTAQYDYTFLGWAVYGTTEIVTLAETVTASVSYQAVYKTEINKYTVSFKNADGSDYVAPATVEYGTTVDVPTAPTKAADETYTYTFDGWYIGETKLEATTVTATQNLTYTAQFTKTYKEYTVTFVNEDGTMLKSAAYHYNDAVTAPTNPTKTVEGETWKFNGWLGTDGITYASTGIPTVKADATYTATYVGGINYYTVRFFIDDVVVYEKDYSHGEAFDYDALGINTDKAADNTYVYTFAGWLDSNENLVAELPTAITAEANYYASYTKQEKTYTVTWIVDGEEYSKKDDYLYNATIVVPTAPTKAGVEGEYRYNFKGWATVENMPSTIVSFSNMKVKADGTYYAIFEIEYLYYDIAFRYAGTNGLISRLSNVAAHTSLADVAHPVKATEYREENGTHYRTDYTFIGWANDVDATAPDYLTSADLPEVTTDATYYALFTSEETTYTPSYTITFKVGTETVATVEAAINTVPVYTEAEPTKEANANYHYTFDGWVVNASGQGTVYESDALPVATEDETYYARFKAGSHNYVVNDAESYPCSNTGDGHGLEVKYCDVCDRKVETETPANHSNTLTKSYEPGYRANGTNFYTCDNCGLETIEEVERLGMAATFQVVDQDGNPVSGALVSVFHGGEVIDYSTTDSNGMVTVYVPKNGGTYEITISADGYNDLNGKITVTPDGDVTKDFGALQSKYCDCTCHKDGIWAKIFRFLYTILYKIFKAECCECQTYLK